MLGKRGQRRVTKKYEWRIYDDDVRVWPMPKIESLLWLMVKQRVRSSPFPRVHLDLNNYFTIDSYDSNRFKCMPTQREKGNKRLAPTFYEESPRTTLFFLRCGRAIEWLLRIVHQELSLFNIFKKGMLRYCIILAWTMRKVAVASRARFSTAEERRQQQQTRKVTSWSYKRISADAPAFI